MEVVKEIRGLGLMAGIELTVAAQPILAELRNSGMIALPAGEKVVRLLPPLNVKVVEIEKAVSIMKETISKNKVAAQ
ncbi:acetylornithine aminotransferase [Mesobacillus boroniphilus JCM 21738]|uniref:Acetylornithine aminotransferase n=1 Tax=Mesobacillus boroniphilus JCM 21738 TaxID=1294265 RepID=W4RQ55_9BACI|nr:acetylornithine aminotransferase [Mesobacillus boroniphilus JCM 21738]